MFFFMSVYRLNRKDIAVKIVVEFELLLVFLSLWQVFLLLDPKYELVKKEASK